VDLDKAIAGRIYRLRDGFDGEDRVDGTRLGETDCIL